jgi:hypothetical protein
MILYNRLVRVSMSDGGDEEDAKEEEVGLERAARD